MMKNTMYRKKAAQLLALLFVILPFQNCSPINAPMTFEMKSRGGSGDSYDGKPGTFYRVIPGFDCNGQKYVVADIEVSAGSARHRTVNQDCSLSENTISSTELDWASHLPELIGYRNGVFQRFPQTPAQAQQAEVTEAWCRFDGPVREEIVIRNQTAGTIAEITAAVASATRTIQVSGRTLTNGSVAYSGIGFFLSIPASFNNMGTSTGQWLDNSNQRSVSCRLSGSLDPLAPQNPPASSFTITGVKSGADGNADNFLSNWTTSPTLEWTRLNSASSYEASIWNQAGTALVCGPISSTQNQATLSSCNFTPGSSYQIRVSANSIYGSLIPASNQNFNFSVPTISTDLVTITPDPAAPGQLIFRARMRSSQNYSNVMIHFQVWTTDWGRIETTYYLNNQTLTAGTDVTFEYKTSTGSPLAAGSYFLGTMASPSGVAQNLTGTISAQPFTHSP